MRGWRGCFEGVEGGVLRGWSGMIGASVTPMLREAVLAALVSQWSQIPIGVKSHMLGLPVWVLGGKVAGHRQGLWSEVTGEVSVEEGWRWMGKRVGGGWGRRWEMDGEECGRWMGEEGGRWMGKKVGDGWGRGLEVDGEEVEIR